MTQEQVVHKATLAQQDPRDPAVPLESQEPMEKTALRDLLDYKVLLAIKEMLECQDHRVPRENVGLQDNLTPSLLAKISLLLT